MQIPKVVMGVSNRDFRGLIDLGNNLAEKLNGNLSYPNPTPSIATLRAAIADTSEAVIKWGIVGNRGSHEDYIYLKNKAKTLHQVIRELSHYVANTAELLA